VKASFGFDPEQSFVVPEDVSSLAEFYVMRSVVHAVLLRTDSELPAFEQVAAFYRSAASTAASHEASWSAMFTAYAAAHPALAAEFQRRFAGKLPDGWMAALPRWKPTDKADATR
jgi:transketolase